MPAKTKPSTAPTLTITRVFDATPERLWTFWTDPAKYAKWLNPAPIDLVIHEFDARPRGKVRFDMPQPDGNKNPQTGVFHSLTPFTEIVTGEPDKSFLVRARFEPVGSTQTRLTVEMTGVPAEHHAGATQGWNAGFDKLERHLKAPSVFATRRTYAPLFTVERTFKAPVEKVWAMWTTKAGLEQWYWPEGMVATVKHLDVRPGGGYDIAAEGLPHTSRGTYTEVVHQQRLGILATIDFLQGVEPYDRIDSIEFHPVPGGTRMVFTASRHHDDHWQAMANAGWASSLDKLQRALETPRGKALGTIVGRSVRIERVIKAPPSKVWAAWSTAATLEKWFWPAGKGKVQEFSFKPGGRLVMAHESQPWKGTWEYAEIVPERRIVIRDHWDDGSGHVATGTIEFQPVEGGTRLVVTHGPFPEKGPYKLEDAVGGFVKVADNLAGLLEGAARPQGFTIERTFKAKPEKVWHMWTTKAGIEAWWVPSARAMGYDMRVLAMDVRVGGKYAFEMKNAEHTLVNQGVYVEVKPHTRLAYVWHFDIFLGPDEKAYDVPITIELQAVPGGTKMTFIQGPLATAEHTEGSRQGVLQNLGHLAKALGE